MASPSLPADMGMLGPEERRRERTMRRGERKGKGV